MVPVSPHTLSLEDSRKAQVLWHLILRDDIICAFGLADDEFTDLGVMLVLQLMPTTRLSISYLKFSVRDRRT